MDIERRISFYLQKVYDGSKKNQAEAQIRMRVQWCGNMLQVNAGHKINPSKWVTSSARCKNNASNLKGVSGVKINKDIQRLTDAVEDIFKSFEVKGIIPTKEQIKEAINEANGKKVAKTENMTIQSAFLQYICERGKLNSWEDSTLMKHYSIRRILCDFDSELLVSCVESKMLHQYHEYLLDRGMQNSSIKKHFSFLRAFLQWATDKGLLNTDWKSFKPEIKLIHKKAVVFLTWEELMKVYNLKFGEDKKYLERVKDCFCFSCFTGLRYSDLKALKRTDVFKGFIQVTTEKTDTTLQIDLNKYSSAILDKYKKMDFGEYALPVPSNQKMNEYLKYIGFMAGLNEPITKVYYIGSERIEEVNPKFKLLGTHTGRRTFICNALMLGVNAEVVMQWTGHKDYKQMMPYIAVATDVKRKSMELFNR